MKLLRLAPLITSTASLMYAHDQHIFFLTFLHPSYRSEANQFFPRWFKICLQRALWPIATLYPLSILSSATNIYLLDPKSADARLWYWSGLAFTTGHFLFGKKAKRLLDEIQNDKSKGKSTEDMREWLDMNFVRSLTVDLLGWVSFVGAAVVGA